MKELLIGERCVMACRRSHNDKKRGEVDNE